MLKIGEINELTILRETSVGLFLGDDEDNDVLLPIKYMPENFEIGDKLSVFIYTDSEDRVIATNLVPKISLNEFAFLQVNAIDQVGAFMDWGLEKDLLVPFKNQNRKMEKDRWYVVFMYLDPESNRLVGSCKVNRYLKPDKVELEIGQQVQILVWESTDLGLNVIIENKYRGLVFRNEIFQKVYLGDVLSGFVKNIRDEDNRVDISLQQQGYQNVEPNSRRILDLLKQKNGFLKLSDKSDPEDIHDELEMSKKTFKKAIGALFREQRIRIEEEGIYLV